MWKNGIRRDSVANEFFKLSSRGVNQTHPGQSSLTEQANIQRYVSSWVTNWRAAKSWYFERNILQN
jgi:hypothetical protein